MKPPPWIQTRTGAEAGVGSGVTTFRFKQSSSSPTGAFRTGSVPGHSVPGWVASRTSCQVSVGAGGRQRRSPTGAAA
jgi:hypothetical protein